MYSVTLRDGKKFQCASEETIFAAAQRQGITLEHSCLSARCESCRCEVVAGTVTHKDDTEKQMEVTATGAILTCNSMPKSDLVLNIEDLTQFNVPKPATLPAKVSKIEMLNESIMKLVLRLPPRRQFQFLPGQYVDIIARKIRRSYSIALNDYDKNELTFYIKKYDGGMMSKYIFSQMKLNDLVQINGPRGTFFARPSPRKKLILATGTGIAPFVAMLSSGQLDMNHASIFWGLRNPDDFFTLDLPDELYSGIQRIVSRPDAHWKGAVGHVQNVAMNQISDLTDYEVYACGNPQMIGSASEQLELHGLSRDRFYSDAFVPSN